MPLLDHGSGIGIGAGCHKPTSATCGGRESAGKPRKMLNFMEKDLADGVAACAAKACIFEIPAWRAFPSRLAAGMSRGIALSFQEEDRI